MIEWYFISTYWLIRCFLCPDGWGDGEEESVGGALRERELRSLHRTVPALRRRELDTRAIKHHFYPEGGWGCVLLTLTQSQSYKINCAIILYSDFITDNASKCLAPLRRPLVGKHDNDGKSAGGLLVPTTSAWVLGWQPTFETVLTQTVWKIEH